MNEIESALRKALAVKPDPEISAKLDEAEKTQHKDRRKKEAVILGGRFEHTGMSWYHLILGIPNMTAGDIKKRWKEELLPQLANVEETERPQVIAQLAKGLYLSENPKNSERDLTRRTNLSLNMDKFLRRFKTERFSPSSKVFFMVIAQMSEYSRDDLNAFGDFLREKDRLPRVGVTIEKSFPAVADWLMKPRNNPQSPRVN